MDRLQIAIQKARAQRAAAQTPLPADADADAGAGPVAPADAGPAQPAAPAPAAGPAWERFPPLDLNSKALRRNRLIVTERGREAAPYDLLRTRVVQQARTNGWKRIGLVSPTAQCGKTTAAINLAFSCSRQFDMRTMLIDLDLRRPSIAKMLGQTVPTGMEDVLQGHVDFADHGRRLGTNVVLGMNNGPAKAPSELLQDRASIERYRKIEATYQPDLVLIDLPPMMETDDNYGFLGNIDAVLLIVAAEQSGVAEIELSIRQLQELTQILGIVLNKCRYNTGVYSYGYGRKYY